MVKELLDNLTLGERDLVKKALNFTKYVIVKNPYMAKINETIESEKEASYFLYAMDSPNPKFNYFEYSIEDFIELGITDEILLKTYTSNKNLVPEDIKSLALANKLKKYRNNYIETNPYYCMLNGQPSRVDEFVKTSIGVYAHNLTEEQFYLLNKSGEIDRLINEYPTYGYLRHINPKMKCSPYESRKCQDFYIIKYNEALMEDLHVRQYIDYYYEILIYTMSTVYTVAYKEQKYYDSYIIMYMLNATLQKFFSNNITNIMRRELYNIDDIRNMFYSYGLPFYDDIPLKYQKKILKNINHLLAYKGTDHVFVDITDIFGFSDTELYRYYLIKDNKRDKEGKPIVTGSIDDFDLKFAQVSLDDKDVSSYLKTNYLYQTYDEVVKDDPYWGQNENGEIDQEIIDEIKKQDFNYLSTKYLSVNTVFNMSECFFETTYFFNLMEQMFKKNLLNDMNMNNSNIKPDGSKINLFDLITALYILLFRRFGYSDYINYKPTQVASIYGFNFDSSTEVIKKFLNEIEDGNFKLYSELGDQVINVISSLDTENKVEFNKILDDIELNLILDIYNNLKINDIDVLANTLYSNDFMFLQSSEVFVSFLRNKSLRLSYEELLKLINDTNKEHFINNYLFDSLYYKNKIERFYNNLYEELRIYVGKKLVNIVSDENKSDSILNILNSDKSFNSNLRLSNLKNFIRDKSYIEFDGKKIPFRPNKKHNKQHIERVNSLIKVLEMPNNPTKEDLLNTYFTSYDFNKEIDELINETEDIRAFRVLNSIKKYNMYSQSITNLYGEEKPENITTYSDFLKKKDRELYDWVNEKSLNDDGTIDKENTIKTIDTILECLELYFNSTKFKNLFVETNITLDLIRKYLIRMISIFKAYTVEIKKINIYYMFDDRYMNTLRIFAYQSMKAKINKHDSIEKNLYDDIESHIKMYFKDDDLFGLTTYLDQLVHIFKNDKINIKDIINLIKTLNPTDLNRITDLSKFIIDLILKDNDLNIDTQTDIYKLHYTNDEFKDYDNGNIIRNYKNADCIPLNVIKSDGIYKDINLIDENRIINGKELLEINYSYIKE